MRSIFPPVKSKPKFALDFSLIPAGIVLLEVSVTLTEALKIHPGTLFNLLLLRAIHTIALISLAFFAEKILKKLKVASVGYRGLWILGLILALLSELFREILTQFIDVQLDLSSHRYLIVLIQGLFWIPVLVIVGGQLTEIFKVFKEYEKRLIINTRINIRNSPRFQNIQEAIEDKIRKELIRESDILHTGLKNSNNLELSLDLRNQGVQPLLKGVSLRALSLKLENESNTASETSVFGQNMHSLSILAKQFKLLYNWMAKKHPLSSWVYTILFTVLIAPSFINFFSIKRILIAWPPLFLVTLLLSKLIVKILKSEREHTIALSNFLIILIGFLPFMENKIGQNYSYSEDTNFPFFLTGVLFPFGYYFYIRFLQITQPAAISSITNDELQASPALQKTVSKIIVQEFTQAISHRWAIYIHGKILTRLAATSLKLEQAVALNDQATFDSALNEIDEILKNPTRDFENGFGTVESEILSRLDPWNGLIEIALSIVPEIASISNPRVRDLGEVIEEIVSNSVRHGGSQIINVEVTQLAHPDIQIVVSDDAQNPLPFVSSRIGLGTKILNLVSDGRWTIFHENSKTTVKLTMSLRDERE